MAESLELPFSANANFALWCIESLFLVHMFQNLVKSGRTLKSKNLSIQLERSSKFKLVQDYSIAIARRMMAYDTAPATSEATTAVRTEESMSSKTSEAVGGEASKAANDKIIHRVKVLNLPTHEVANVKKLFTSLGLKRHKKAPAWDYAFLTFEVSIQQLNLHVRMVRAHCHEYIDRRSCKRSHGKT